MSKKEEVLGTEKNTNMIYALVGIIGVAGIYLVFTGSGASASSQSVTDSSTDYLSVDISDVTSTVKFFEYTTNTGRDIQFMVVKGTDNEIHAALNTCEVCYTSGKGHYTQNGEWLTCANCGRQFHIDNLGIVKGGCNPVPFDFELVGTELRVQKSELDSKENYFRY